MQGVARRGNLCEPSRSITGAGLDVLFAPGPALPANVEASHLPFSVPVSKSVIARSSATRQSTRTGLFDHGDRPGRNHGFWDGCLVSSDLVDCRVVRCCPSRRSCASNRRRGSRYGATRRKPLLAMTCTVAGWWETDAGACPGETGCPRGVLAAPGPVLPSTSKRPTYSFLAAHRKSVIARSSATRQSTRTGLFAHGDRPGRTQGLWDGCLVSSDLVDCRVVR